MLYDAILIDADDTLFDFHGAEKKRHRHHHPNSSASQTRPRRRSTTASTGLLGSLRARGSDAGGTARAPLPRFPETLRPRRRPARSAAQGQFSCNAPLGTVPAGRPLLSAGIAKPSHGMQKVCACRRARTGNTPLQGMGRLWEGRKQKPPQVFMAVFALVGFVSALMLPGFLPPGPSRRLQASGAAAPRTASAQRRACFLRPGPAHTHPSLLLARTPARRGGLPSTLRRCDRCFFHRLRLPRRSGRTRGCSFCNGRGVARLRLPSISRRTAALCRFAFGDVFPHQPVERGSQRHSQKHTADAHHVAAHGDGRQHPQRGQPQLRAHNARVDDIALQLLQYDDEHQEQECLHRRYRQNEDGAHACADVRAGNGMSAVAPTSAPIIVA